MTCTLWIKVDSNSRSIWSSKNWTKTPASDPTAAFQNQSQNNTNSLLENQGYETASQKLDFEAKDLAPQVNALRLSGLLYAPIARLFSKKYNQQEVNMANNVIDADAMRQILTTSQANQQTIVNNHQNMHQAALTQPPQQLAKPISW